VAGGQSPQEVRELLVRQSTPGDFNDVQIRQTPGKVGEVAAQKLSVASLGAVTGYAPAAGWSRRAAPDGSHSGPPRRHAAVEPLHDRLPSPAGDHRSLGVQPDQTDTFGIDVGIE
jgi:hypothetical protein